MLGFLFKDNKLNNAAHILFSQIIDQSRIPAFYTDYAVDDTLDGRFDLMALHMSLVINKLDQTPDRKNISTLKRMLQEAMFDNLDLTMREIGVGDLGVGKKVKVMAEAFYGRIKVYQEILDKNDKSKMREALERNLYRHRKVEAKVVENMVYYYFAQWINVAGQKIEDVVCGKLTFERPQGQNADE